jgi:hypothetical protein
MEYVPSKVNEGQVEISYQSFNSIRERYANKFMEWTDGRGRSQSTPVAPVWLSHPRRRQYEGVDMPNGPPVSDKGYLNLWHGWGVIPKQGSWMLLQRHIAEVMANGDREFETYIRNWTAWKFQNPGAPPEVVLAFLGEKGVGKGAWGRALMRVFGQHALQIFSTPMLTGKHNQHLQDKLFLFLDEAMWAGDRDGERVLKGLATEPWLMIEPKNVNAFQWRNRLGIMMSGNDNWIVPATHDERRYAVNQVSKVYKQNEDYFTALFAEIEGDGPAAMLYDLLSLDLKGWHPRAHAPQTKTLMEQKALGLTGLQQWYVHLLSVGELPKAQAKNPRMVLSKHLFEHAKGWSPRTKFINETEFGRFLRYECGCEHKSTGKAWGWILPPLAEARAAWVVKAGDWPWLAPEVNEWGEKPVLEDG